jgi:hypothetical protein
MNPAQHDHQRWAGAATSSITNWIAAKLADAAIKAVGICRATGLAMT